MRRRKCRPASVRSALGKHPFVRELMAPTAQRDQIRGIIRAPVLPRHDVVHFQKARRATPMRGAAVPVARKHFRTQRGRDRRAIGLSRLAYAGIAGDGRHLRRRKSAVPRACRHVGGGAVGALLDDDLVGRREVAPFTHS